MRYLVAVDVGIKNLGLCVFDFVTAQFVFWDNVSLVPNGRYMPCQNVQYVRDFCKRYAQYFDDAAAVLVERQMRCNMRIIEAVLQTLYFERCHIINARSVKAHYHIGTKNYRLNKQRAIEWAQSFLNANGAAFATNVSDVFQQKLKRDDLADSLLLVCYYLDTYSNQLGKEPGFYTLPSNVAL